MINPANDSRILYKLKEWRKSALLFVNDVFDVKPTEQQTELLRAIADEPRISVRSGHGPGKSASAAWVIWWFLATRAFPRIAVTAPTAHQITDVLWAELTKWYRKSRLGDEFVIQSDKIFHKDHPKDWWCVARSVNVRGSADEQAETLSGLHADHLLVVVDEASGVPDPVYLPLEGAMTGADNHLLLIGNMTKNKGYFYDTHFDTKLNKQWRKLHWDSRKSTNVSKQMIQFYLDKYGEESNIFRIRVAGDPPLEDENTLIPLAWAIQCVDSGVVAAEDEPLYLGVDVARYGDDASVILPRKGYVISPWETMHSMNTITQGGMILQTYKEMEAEGIAIDEIGVGAGVTDWLYKHGHLNCFGVNVANKSSNPKQYHRLRDELWWRVRENCAKGLYNFPPGDDYGKKLCDELSTPTYEFDTNGAVVVESKPNMKKRGVPSPNIADALCLTEYFHSTAHRIWAKDKEKKRKQREAEQTARYGANAWMVY